MTDGHDARTAGERVDSLLAELRATAGQQAAGTAEDLVRCLVELYGAGLAGIVAILREDEQAGPRLMARLAADPLVESLLLVHDLHPLDAETRIKRALRRVPVAGTLEYLGADEQGVVWLRQTGHSCQSSSEAARQAVAEAVMLAAPEMTHVDIDAGEAELPLLQITRRPASTR